MLRQTYCTSLALLTDLYQLTMAYGYWKLGRADQQAVFHLFFRKPPFNGGYAVTAGLAYVLELLRDFSFQQSDLDYLATLTGADGKALFSSEFLHYLRQLRLSCDIHAMPEGTVAFAAEPMIRVCGPILQCQILESAILNLMNFQTLTATKAARVCLATGGDPVLEFGLRRAQGIDGALTATRAAYIGGCAATSNVLAGKLMGIPVRGTHAHSWVMSFDDEAESFEGYARAMPNNCVFLVDTYDTLQGVKNAIEIGHTLRRQGHKLVGIRLDSGDLAYLSIEARRMLDQAGFADTVITASNDLDEHLIENLKMQGAKIAIWGVGTKLATSYDQPALGGVYKLGAIRNSEGNWQPKLKLSEQVAKTTIPGILQVRRFRNRQGLIADMIYDESTGIDQSSTIVDPEDPSRRRKIGPDAQGKDLLIPVFRNGQTLIEQEPLEQIRSRAAQELADLHPGIRRLMHPHQYPVGLEPTLHDLRQQMIAGVRDSSTTSPENAG